MPRQRDEHSIASRAGGDLERGATIALNLVLRNDDRKTGTVRLGGWSKPENLEGDRLVDILNSGQEAPSRRHLFIQCPGHRYDWTGFGNAVIERRVVASRAPRDELEPGLGSTQRLLGVLKRHLVNVICPSNDSSLFTGIHEVVLPHIFGVECGIEISAGL